VGKPKWVGYRNLDMPTSEVCICGKKIKLYVTCGGDGCLAATYAAEREKSLRVRLAKQQAAQMALDLHMPETVREIKPERKKKEAA
jgi:hypothetical protein